VRRSQPLRRTPVRARRAVVALTTILVAVVLAGCGSGPGRGDAAAIVGTQVVPIEQIQEQLRVVAPQLRSALDEQAAQTGTAPGAAVPNDVLAAQSRRLLTVAVFHDLLTEQAARDGVTASPQQVDQAMAALGGPQAASASGYDDATFRQVVTDRVLATQIGRRAFDRLAVTVDYATVANRAEADRLAARLAADPTRARDLFAGLPQGSAASGLALRPGSDFGNGAQAAASSVVFGLPAGTVAVVAPPAQAQAENPDPSTQPWTVIHVAQRSLDAPPGGPGLTPGSAVDDRTMTEVGLRLVQPLALQLGVTINPRYGTWDPSQLAIVSSPSAAGTVSPVATPAQ
jgi:hypothetical protein